MKLFFKDFNITESPLVTVFTIKVLTLSYNSKNSPFLKPNCQWILLHTPVLLLL